MTHRLSDYARKFTYPPGIKRTVWTRVEAKGLEIGLGFDWWQSQAGTVCLGYGEDGRYVATVGGIGMSIPRQVGKTYFVLSMLVILCILFPGLQVVWTAHHLRTSTKTFTTLRGICRRKKVAPHVRAMRAANGEQQVEFVNGSTIMFGARSQGFGRGFDEIDVEVFDEAQIMDTKALEDMIAATNQARHPHGALLFFMGTPPRPADPSESFSQRRAEAWAGEAEDAIWLEIGADPASGVNDESQYPLMNPSYPLRTPPESMQRLRKNLKDDDSWNREGRGVWDVAATDKVFGAGKWEACAGPEYVGKFGCLAVATAVDQSATTIAGVAFDGERYVGKPLESGPGQSWALGSLKALYALNQVPVVVDARGPAAALVPHLRAAGVRVETLDTAQVLDAHANLFQLVQDVKFQHGRYPELDAAVAGATTRNVGDRWAWARRKSAADISPLEAVTLGVGYLFRPSSSGPVFAFS